MSWSLTIRGTTAPLGDPISTQPSIQRIFPSVEFNIGPTGVERIRLFEERGIHLPPLIRESLISQPATLRAEVDLADLSLVFDLGSDDPARELIVEVRGAGDPFPLVRQLAEIPNWEIVDDFSGKSLGKDAQPGGTGWEEYQKVVEFERSRQRWPTSESIDKLTTLLNLRQDYGQDWEIEIADPDRLAVFLDVYERGALNDDDRFALMALIVASFDDWLLEDEHDGTVIERVLRNLTTDFHLHECTIAYWSQHDRPDLENLFNATPFMREVWHRHHKSSSASQLS